MFCLHRLAPRPPRTMGESDTLSSKTCLEGKGPLVSDSDSALQGIKGYACSSFKQGNLRTFTRMAHKTVLRETRFQGCR